MNKVRFGILGVSYFAVHRMLPALQKCGLVELAAIASRDRTRAEAAAREFAIPKAYGSYEELLADPEIDAVYNPLPNHMHVPWSIRAAEARKHVLCEKPIGMNADEVRKLIEVRNRTGVVIQEAFMVQTHPQWVRVMDLVRAGRIGDLRAAVCTFSYFRLDADNIRNIREYGGGALMDIGCYAVKCSRMLFGGEPVRVSAAMIRDPRVDNVDGVVSGILEFPNGHGVFMCSSQISLQQSIKFLGSSGRIEIELPFNPVADAATRIRIDDGRDLLGSGMEVEDIPPSNQYTIQGDLFARAIREGRPPAVPLEDSLKNAMVLDAIVRAAETGCAERV
ncbi:MAG TPA: Gfo/Idh/MocA family oxidoreductase [Bryobacteraceae bacterium]